MAEKPPKNEPFVLAQTHFQACVAVRDFIENKVYPILSRDENVALPERRLNRALAARALTWMRSLGKLNHASDSQAVLAGSRGLFELAVDYTLLKHDTENDFAKLRAWQESEKFRWAQRVKDHKVFGPPFQEARANKAAPVRELRGKYWNGKHPPRWTGRSLAEDAKVADRAQDTGFVEYHTVHYPMACWQIHGSGAIGLLETGPDQLPFFSGQGFAHCARFAIAISAHALDQIGQYDAIVDERFKELNKQITGIQFAAMPPEEQKKTLARALRRT